MEPEARNSAVGWHWNTHTHSCGGAWHFSGDEGKPNRPPVTPRWLIQMGHFEIFILKLNYKINISETNRSNEFKSCILSLLLHKNLCHHKKDIY